MDRKTFASIMMALSALYPKYELQEETLSAYYAILGDLDADLLKAATLQYGSESKWFPTAAELRQTAFDLLDRSDGRMSAYEAWGEVVRKIGTHGVYRGEPSFDEPAIAHAIAGVGGWRSICMTPEDSLFSTRARFIEAYKRWRSEERTATRALPQIRELTHQLSADRSKMLESETNSVQDS